MLLPVAAGLFTGSKVSALPIFYILRVGLSPAGKGTCIVWDRQSEQGRPGLTAATTKTVARLAACRCYDIKRGSALEFNGCITCDKGLHVPMCGFTGFVSWKAALAKHSGKEMLRHRAAHAFSCTTTLAKTNVSSYVAQMACWCSAPKLLAGRCAVCVLEEKLSNQKSTLPWTLNNTSFLVCF
jgi:hypothetical protein